MSFVITERTRHPVHHISVFIYSLLLYLFLCWLALAIYYNKFWIKLVVDLIRHPISACILEGNNAVVTRVAAGRWHRHCSVIRFCLMFLLQNLYWDTLALSGQRCKLHFFLFDISVIFLILTTFLIISGRTCTFYLQLLLLGAIHIREPLFLLFLLLNFEGFVAA